MSVCIMFYRASTFFLPQIYFHMSPFQLSNEFTDLCETWYEHLATVRRPNVLLSPCLNNETLMKAEIWCQ